MSTYSSFDQAFVSTLVGVLEEGTPSAPRGMGTLDLTCEMFELSDPRARLLANEPRGAQDHYNAASVMWNIAMRNDVEGICWWNENGRRISDDGVTFHGADYGSRILRKRGPRHRSPLFEAIALLKDDPDTRRAWVPIHNWWHDGSSYAHEGKDVPCTIGFQLRLVDGELLMQVVMRSQAVFGVMPYDVFFFTYLQELIANELGAELGRYEHVMLSAHIYERERERAEQAIVWAGKHAEPMDPIDTTLSEAQEFYPQIFEDMTTGYPDSWKSSPEVLVGMMLPYAREKEAGAELVE